MRAFSGKDTVGLADSIRSGEISASSVVAHTLQLIDSANASVNAFVSLDPEKALALAGEIDEKIKQGIDPGPLAGIPFGVKDTHHVEGMVTSFGSVFFKDNAPEQQDAVYISRLRRAGAIPVGKTAAAEFGLDSATNSRAWGVTRNPWNLELTAGGSSGGSAAAVTAGMVPFCSAGDGGGSIREPASFCGLVGLKPSNGRIPNAHGFDTMSCIGALTTTVRDTARFLDIASGPDDSDHLSLPKPDKRFEDNLDSLDISGLKTVWSADLGYAVVDPAVAEICRKAAALLIEEASLVQLDRDVKLDNYFPDWAGIVVSEARADLELLGIWPQQKYKLSDTPLTVLERYGCDSPVKIAASRKRLVQLEKQLAAFFREADLLITPAVACLPFAADAPIPATLNGHDITSQGVEPFGMLANVCGNPAISIPAGRISGLPVGMQIMARRHREDLLLRLARVMELVQPWPKSAPAVA